MMLSSALNVDAAAVGLMKPLMIALPVGVMASIPVVSVSSRARNFFENQVAAWWWSCVSPSRKYERHE